MVAPFRVVRVGESELGPARPPEPVDHAENGLDVGAWLAMELRRRGISQRMLAERTGVDHSTISRLIRGHRDPSLATVVRLARGLDIGDTRAIRLVAGPRETTMRNAAMAAQNGRERQLELALRADPLLTDQAAADILNFYRAVRAQRVPRERLHRQRRSAAGRTSTDDFGPRPETSENPRPA